MLKPPALDIEAEKKLEELLRCAGDALLEYWPGISGSSSKELDAQRKGDGSLVTEADYTSNAIISGGLELLFPGDAVHTEELPLNIEQKQAPRVWIVDPLDGTSHFVEGLDDFSIQLALCIDHQVVFGAMFFPVHDRYLSGNTGKGAKLNGKALKVSSSESLRAGSLYHRGLNPQPADYLCKESLDSGMALLKLCDGSLDGVALNMTRFGEYDVAAAALLVAECGGKVTDEMGDPLHFCLRHKTCRYFIASNGKVHDQILRLVAQ